MTNYPTVKVPQDLSKSFFEMNERELKEYFNWFLVIKEERLKILNSFLMRNYEYELDGSVDSLKKLFEFYKKIISEREATQEERQIEEDKITGLLKGHVFAPTKILTDETTSVCFDIGIYIGELLIKNIASVEWNYKTSPKRYIHYGQPILMKKGKVGINPRAGMELLAKRILHKETEVEELIELYRIWEESLIQ